MTTINRITSATVAFAIALGAPAALADSSQQLLGPAGRPNQEKPNNTAGSVSAQPTIVRISSPNGGFDWGDAGIGAAGGIALSLIGIGGALALSGRRARRPTAHRT